MRCIFFLVLSVLLLSLSSGAVSVVSDYLVNDTLELTKGTSKIYSIRLQNPTDAEVGIKLDYDTAFMKAIDYKEVYTLPPKTAGYKILFNVTAPKEPGLYTVSYTVGEVEPSGGAGLPILLKINKNFKLKVIKEPSKFHIRYDYVVYALAVLAFLLYAFRKKSTIKPKK